MKNTKPILIDSYKTHIHIIQNLSFRYHFVLEIYPNNSVNPFMIVSQSTHSLYEYAIESGIESLEELGFVLSDEATIDVYKIEGDDYNKVLVNYNGSEFSTISEEIIDRNDYFDKFQSGK